MQSIKDEERAKRFARCSESTVPRVPRHNGCSASASLFPRDPLETGQTRCFLRQVIGATGENEKEFLFRSFLSKGSEEKITKDLFIRVHSSLVRFPVHSIEQCNEGEKVERANPTAADWTGLLDLVLDVLRAHFTCLQIRRRRRRRSSIGQ